MTRLDKQDPRQEGPIPPFPEQKQTFPGVEEQLQPKADHGEQSYRGTGRLKGKVAIVTGADSGIGRAVTIAFAREGADVLIVYLNEHQDAEETRRWVEQAGQKAVLLAGDISQEQFCQQVVQRAMDEFGRVNILVNNAAYSKSFQDLQEITAEEFDFTFRTNIHAIFFLCKAAMPAMQPGSSIINTASIQAYHPSPEILPYAATKGAIVTFTKGLAKQAIKQGIRVNAVTPGPVWTPLVVASQPSAAKNAAFGQDNPMGRPAQPAELAPIYVLLASDESSYINGGIYDVAGGESTA